MGVSKPTLEWAAVKENLPRHAKCREASSFGKAWSLRRTKTTPRKIVAGLCETRLEARSLVAELGGLFRGRGKRLINSLQTEP